MSSLLPTWSRLFAPAAGMVGADPHADARADAQGLARAPARLDELLAQGGRLARWRIGATLAWRPGAQELPEAVFASCLEALPALVRCCAQPRLLLPASLAGHDRIDWLQLAETAATQGVGLALDLPAAAQDEAAVQALLVAARAAEGPVPDWSLALSRLRSRADIERVAALGALGAGLRLVHGRGLDPGEQRQGGREGDLDWTAIVAGHLPRLTLVTHDAAYADAVLARLRPSGLPCALEMVAELPRQRILAVARHHAVGLRMVLSRAAGGDAARAPLAREPRTLWWNTLSSGLDTLLPAQPAVLPTSAVSAPAAPAAPVRKG